MWATTPLMSNPQHPPYPFIFLNYLLTVIAETVSEMAAAIPDARLVVIEDCGHLPTLERPDEVNVAMRAWLLETKTS